MKIKGSNFKKNILFFTSIFLLVINLNSEEKKLPNFYDNVPNEELAAYIVENMTDEELWLKHLCSAGQAKTPETCLFHGLKTTDWEVSRFSAGIPATPASLPNPFPFYKKNLSKEDSVFRFLLQPIKKAAGFGM